MQSASRSAGDCAQGHSLRLPAAATGGLGDVQRRRVRGRRMPELRHRGRAGRPTLAASESAVMFHPRAGHDRALLIVRDASCSGRRPAGLLQRPLHRRPEALTPASLPATEAAKPDGSWGSSLAPTRRASSLPQGAARAGRAEPGVCGYCGRRGVPLQAHHETRTTGRLACQRCHNARDAGQPTQRQPATAAMSDQPFTGEELEHRRDNPRPRCSGWGCFPILEADGLKHWHHRTGCPVMARITEHDRRGRGPPDRPRGKIFSTRDPRSRCPPTSRQAQSRGRGKSDRTTTFTPPLPARNSFTRQPNTKECYER